MNEVSEISKQEFKLSKDAINRIKFLLKNEKGSYFRISVLGGGCSGFQYDFSFVSSPNSDDLVFKESGIKNRGLGAYFKVLNGIASDINKIVKKLKFVNQLVIHFGFSRARKAA